MAIDMKVAYPSNTAPASGDYPVGEAQNESYDGAKDYFPLEKTWVNELLGFLGALLDDVGFTADGTPEIAGSSQYLDAIKAQPISVGRLTDGSKDFGSLSIRFGNATAGRCQLSSNVGSYGSITTNSPTSKTSYHDVRMLQGALSSNTALSDSHNLIPIMKPINVSDIAFYTGVSIPFISVTGIDFTGINFGIVYRTELIMKNSTIVGTFPLRCSYSNNSGTLRLVEGSCATYAGDSWSPGLFVDHYLHIWMDPANIV